MKTSRSLRAVAGMVLVGLVPALSILARAAEEDPQLAARLVEKGVKGYETGENCGQTCCCCPVSEVCCPDLSGCCSD